MAEAVPDQSDDEEITQLAEGIVETQEREVAEMNDFRQEEFGAPVPATAGGSEESGSGGGEHGSGH